MSDPTPNQNLSIEFALILGELRGQIKELVHSVNNRASESQGVANSLAKLESVPRDIAEIKKSFADLELRLDKVELDKAANSGERKMLLAILQSPALGWLVWAGSVIWALLSGRIQ